MIADEDQARTWLHGLAEWDGTAASRIERLLVLLAEENRSQNLVSAASLEEVWRRHVVDSAQLLSHVARGSCSPWIDLGTGAGFPGLVVAALRPECRVLMIESRARRIDWLRRACAALGLDRAEVVGLPVERVPDMKAAVISARAFAPLPRLLDLAARFSTEDTVWLLPKGRSARKELDLLTGWNHLFHVEQSLTDPEAGVIVGHLHGRKGRKAK